MKGHDCINYNLKTPQSLWLCSRGWSLKLEVLDSNPTWAINLIFFHFRFTSCRLGWSLTCINIHVRLTCSWLCGWLCGWWEMPWAKFMTLLVWHRQVKSCAHWQSSGGGTNTSKLWSSVRHHCTWSRSTRSQSKRIVSFLSPQTRIVLVFLCFRCIPTHKAKQTQSKHSLSTRTVSFVSNPRQCSALPASAPTNFVGRCRINHTELRDKKFQNKNKGRST